MSSNNGESWRLAGAVMTPRGIPHRVHDGRALDAPFPPVYRAFARFLAATRSLGNAPIDGYVARLEADEAVVSFERHFLSSAASITPETIHSSRLRRSVVAEHDSSAILR